MIAAGAAVIAGVWQAPRQVQFWEASCWCDGAAGAAPWWCSAIGAAGASATLVDPLAGHGCSNANA